MSEYCSCCCFHVFTRQSARNAGCVRKVHIREKGTVAVRERSANEFELCRVERDLEPCAYTDYSNRPIHLRKTEDNRHFSC